MAGGWAYVPHNPRTHIVLYALPTQLDAIYLLIN